MGEKQRDTDFLSHNEQSTLIEDYVERETAVACKRVEDAEAAIRQKREIMGTADNTDLATRQPEKLYLEKMVAIKHSLSDLASSDDGEDGDGEDDEETEQGNLSEDDEPSWVMGIISKTVQQRMERFRQMQMKLDKLTQPRWGDAANYFGEIDKKYGTSEFMVPAVLELQTDDDAAAPAPTIVGELMECLDIDPGISQMLQPTSHPGSCSIRLGAGKPQSDRDIAGLAPAAELD